LAAFNTGNIVEETIVETRHCRIAIALSPGKGPALLMIHGNSSCKEVFRNQLQGSIGSEFRCIAMDLPGHGHSTDALDPESTYSIPGYADVALDVMRALGDLRCAVLGWSLGGHVGLEMMNASGAVRGLMITGTPPIRKGPGGFEAAFTPSRHMVLAGQRHFNAEEIDVYSRATCGAEAPFESFLRDAVVRTDGRARENMLRSLLAGAGCDQRDAAEHSRAPLAIVDGANDEFIDHAYIASLTYDRLWEGKVYNIEGVGHAPFWEAPGLFDPYLRRFMLAL
jgi:pimeloyl-ACP methyl ester carboxylesterase